MENKLKELKGELVKVVQETYQICQNRWLGDNDYVLSMGDKVIGKYEYFTRTMYSAIGEILIQNGFSFEFENDGSLLVKLPKNDACHITIYERAGKKDILFESRKLCWQEITF